MNNTADNGNDTPQLNPPPAADETAAAIPATIQELLRRVGLESADPKVVKILLEASLTKFQGWLQFPPAEILRGWESVIPGITAKLVTWSEAQTKHRQKLETLRANRSEDRADRGQLMAFGIAVLGLILATVLGLYGHTTASVFMGIVSVGGPAAAVALANKGSLKLLSKTASPPRD